MWALQYARMLEDPNLSGMFGKGILYDLLMLVAVDETTAKLAGSAGASSVARI